MIATMFLVGCATASEPKPVGRVEIPAMTDEHPHATVKLLNEVVVKLPPIETAGNVWTLVLNDARFLRELQPVTMTPDGGAVATFMATRAGRRPIRFFALPPKSREGTPTQAYEILITIE